MTGSKQFTFEGHSAPVYSLYAHRKKDIDVKFYSFFISIERIFCYLFP